MTTALMFPGQGSQQSDMRGLVQAHRPGLLELAEEVVGVDPFEHAHLGTAFLQPAIFAASLTGAHLMSEVEPDYYAGHSLGELAALVAAGSLAERDGMHVVAARGRLMQEAANAQGDGAMLAVALGISSAGTVAERFGLTIANDNSPEQVVLSGHSQAIQRALTALKECGVRAVRLPIEGAFHSQAMEPIVDAFRAVLDGVEFRTPRRPVFSSVTASEFDDIRERLAQSLTMGVRWRELVIELQRRGVDRFVEAGPGRALTGLVLRTLKATDTRSAQVVTG